MRKKLPIGVDNFAELADKQNNYIFVDKTLMIKEVIDGGELVSLILRPRRWGKSLNMSMLRYFFAPTVKGEDTKGLFDTLKIAKVDNGKYLQYQGKHPVIFVTLKDIRALTFESFVEQLRHLIAGIFWQYPELSDSPELSQEDREEFERLANQTSTESELSDALLTLSTFLKAHYKSRVFILIDEYDTPLNVAYNKSHFDRLVNFLECMFGAALKGNNALAKGIITGILKLSQNSMTSGLNNLVVYTFWDKKYSNSFGFSENEVSDLFQAAGVSADLQQVRDWYNITGRVTAVSNPWSILRCISNEGECKPYWADTGDGELLRTILTRPNLQTKVQTLLTGGCVEAIINDIPLDQKVNGAAIWSLLWAWGYLNIVEDCGHDSFSLKIPNYEIQYVCELIFIQPAMLAVSVDRYDALMDALVSGNVDVFLKDLEDFLPHYCRRLDLTEEKEYHLWVLSWICYLQRTYHIDSNQSRTGSSDLILTPKEPNQDWGIIFALQHNAELEKDSAFYEGLAKAGLEHLNDSPYDVALKRNPHLKQILKLSLAFYGKQVASCYSIEAVPSLSE